MTNDESRSDTAPVCDGVFRHSSFVILSSFGIPSFVILFFATQSQAATPGLSTVVPPVLQRGVANDVRLFGKEFAGEMELILPFAAEVKGAGSGREAAAFSIHPPQDLPLGVYPVRVRTPDGISNLRLIAVTDTPIVRAREPNGGYRNGLPNREHAQPIEWPCIIVGDRLERDLDMFRFNVKQGDRLTFITETWRLGLTPDPLIRLRDPRGKMIAYAHDTPTLQRDERLDHTFAQAGEHLLEMQSTGGGGWTNHYLVKVGPFDFVRSVFPLGGRRGEDVDFTIIGRDGKASIVRVCVPDDPWQDLWRLRLAGFPGALDWQMASGDYREVVEDEAQTDAPLVTWPITINGRIAKPDEYDSYRVAVQPGQTLRVRVEAFHHGSALDGLLLIYDAGSKKLLAQHDDQIGRGLPDPAVDVPVPEGTNELLIVLHDVLRRGGAEFGYRLTIEQGGPDFLLWLGRKQLPTNQEDDGWHRMDKSDTLSLAPGQETSLRLSVRRAKKTDDPHYNGPAEGYSGPIRVTAEQLPAGVTVTPGEIAPDKTEADLVFIATDSAPRGPFEIVVIGEGTRADGTVIRRIAERRLCLSDPQIPNLPWNWRVTKVTCVTTRTAAIVKEPTP